MLEPSEAVALPDLQTRIVQLAALAREIDVEQLVRQGEAGKLVSTVPGHTAEDLRMLAVGVARLRGMAEAVVQNQTKRKP
jgi:hypothetical protein